MQIAGCRLKSLKQIPATFLFLLLLVPQLSAFSVSLDSNIVKEGDIIKVTVINEKPIKAAEVEFRKEKYPVFFQRFDRQKNSYVYGSILPVPLGTSGRKKMVLRYLLDGETLEQTQQVNIKKVRSARTKLQTGNLYASLRTSLADEGELIYKFQEKITAVRYKFPFIMPVQGRTSEEFGAQRLYDESEEVRYHKGTDIPAKEGTSVKAANNGTVEVAANSKGYGKTIIINHGGGIYTLYFHMSKLYAHKGQQVNTGDIIGEVGSTGLSTGPHLHWQINAFKVPVNPDKFLTAF